MIIRASVKQAGANCALVLATAEGYVLRVSLGQDGEKDDLMPVERES